MGWVRGFGLAALAIMAGASPAGSTPDPAFHRRVLLLGIDSVSTWSIVVERTQPGSHYFYADSTLLERADFEGRVLRREVLRAISHSDTSTNGQWVELESDISGTDAIALMRRRRIPPAYPSLDLEPCGLSFDRAGIHLSCWGDTALVVRAKGDAAGLNWEEPETVRLLGVFSVPSRLLLLLASGRTDGDGDYIERIVPLKREVFEVLRFPDDH